MSANRNINHQITFKNEVVLQRLPKTTNGNGAVAGSGVSVVERGDGLTHRSVFTFTNFVIPLTDQAGVIAFGGVKFYDFPEGILNIIRAVANLVVTKSSAGVNANWNGDFSVGTVTASNNNTLTATEADIIPSTPTPAASGGATTAKGFSTSSQNTVHDGSATAKDAFLNFLVDDTDHNVAGTACNFIINGTIVIDWSLPLDY